MDILLFNTQWMLYNISLAVIAVIFGWLSYQTKDKKWKYILGIIWILFLPNTIYILTDIQHFYEDFVLIPQALKSLLILEYALLMISGIVTFVFAMYPMELMLKKTKSKTKIIEHDVFFMAMNFLVAFGVVLGRVQRANSWDVIFNIKQVIYDAFHVISTTELLLFFIFFGLLCNVVYFPFRSLMQRYEKSFLRK